MFLQQDLDTMMNVTGLSEDALMENKELEHEYMLRLRMFHLDGNQGPLRGIAMIDCLRFCGIEPKPLEVKKTAALTDWRNVPVMTKVLVKRKLPADGSIVQVLGSYLGEFAMGRLAVRFEGSNMVEESSAIDVEIAPETLAENVLTSVASDAQDDVNDWGETEVVTTEADEKALALDPADLTGRWKAPVMVGAWDDVNPGDSVLCEYQGKTLTGKFIDVGPTDGHVEVLFEDYGGKKGNHIQVPLHEKNVVPDLQPAK